MTRPTAAAILHLLVTLKICKTQSLFYESGCSLDAVVGYLRCIGKESTTLFHLFCAPERITETRLTGFEPFKRVNKISFFQYVRRIKSLLSTKMLLAGTGIFGY